MLQSATILHKKRSYNKITPFLNFKIPTFVEMTVINLQPLQTNRHQYYLLWLNYSWLNL